MNLGDTFITIFVILLVACIFFIFPLMVTANQSDSASQVSLQTYMTNFVNEICDTGKITKESYDKLIETITGPNTYQIEIEVKILDDNPSKKIIDKNPNIDLTKIEKNVSVSYYTSQIVKQLDENGCLFLKEGDQVHISIKNDNSTLSNQLSLFSNSEISTIVAETTQTCTVNGI